MDIKLTDSVGVELKLVDDIFNKGFGVSKGVVALPVTSDEKFSQSHFI